MKNTHLFLLGLLVLLGSACQEAPTELPTAATPTTTFDEAQALADIMTVIEAETKCFFERDYDCWKNYWIHEAYAFQAWNNSNGSFDAAVGWEQIHAQGKDYIETIPEGQTPTSHPVVKRGKVEAKFYSETLAYLLWKQYNSDRKNEYFTPSQEVRLMEKQGDNWKIVNVSAFWDYTNKIPVDSLKI
ncbi:MAG: hypothetical protein KDC44_21685 [Phaeodactylibacter sp.]|nr:hypothetical protein [Phaeodactylibacter sp.]